VSDTSRDEYRRSGIGSLYPVAVAKREFTLQDMPRFIVRVVDMEHGWAAAAPLVNLK